jgi:hypothetical protein
MYHPVDDHHKAEVADSAGGGAPYGFPGLRGAPRPRPRASSARPCRVGGGTLAPVRKPHGIGATDIKAANGLLEKVYRLCPVAP